MSALESLAKIANVPELDFEAAVEDDDPPTDRILPMTVVDRAMRERSEYERDRDRGICTKCRRPAIKAVCDYCRPLGYPSRRAFLAADRREELIALSELSALHRVGAQQCE